MGATNDILTAEQMAQVQDALREVMDSGGFGEVRVVVERRRVVRLEKMIRGKAITEKPT